MNASRAALILILVVSVVVLGCGTKDNWKRLKSSEGEFSAMMPFPTRVEKKSIKTEAGVIQISETKSEDGELEFSVAYADYPLDAACLKAPSSVMLGNVCCQGCRNAEIWGF